MVSLQEILSRVREPKKESGEWLAYCPCHRDGEKHGRRSLAIREKPGGGVLLHCFSGCDYAAIVEALGLGGNGSTPKKPEKKIVATYPYHDADGNLLAQIVRYAPKSFAVRRPDGHSGWIWDRKGLPALLYRLPEMLEGACDGRTVLVVEGERAADAAAGVGLVATTCPFGAGKWTPEHAALFPEGSTVGILPDNDEPGRAHAELVARTLLARGCDPRIVELPGLPPKGDIVEYLEAGGTRDDVLMMVDRAPSWKPPELEAEPETEHEEKIEIAAAAEPEPVKRKRFPILTAAEILAMPDLRWIVQDIVLEDSMIQCFGEPGAYKSFIAQDVALHIATGRDWHGHHVAEPQLVFYVLGEAVRGFKKRLAAWLSYHGLTADDLALFRLIPEPVQLVNVGDVAILIERLREHLGDTHPGEVGLVVYDTLSMCLRGEKENAPEVMTAACGGVRDLREHFGGSSWIVHHCGRDTTHDRGHTSLYGECDTVFQAIPSGPLAVDLKVRKQRNEEAGHTFRAELAREDESLVVTDLRLLTASETGAKADAKAEDRRARVLTHVKNAPEPLTLTAIESAVSGRRDSLRNDLAALTANGELKTGTKTVKGREVCTWQA